MIKPLQWCARIAWLAASALGTTLWFAPGATGNIEVNLQVHMALGGIVALILAILAVWALIDRVRIPAAVAGLIWAIGVVVVGTVQDWWIGGGSHAGIAVIHLVLGMGAIGLAEMLAAAISRSGITRKPASLA